MDKLSKRSKILSEIDAESAFFPEEDVARRHAETVYETAFELLSSRQAKDEFAVNARIGDPLIAEAVLSRLTECIYLSVAYQRGKFHYFDQGDRERLEQAASAAEQILYLLNEVPTEPLDRFFSARRRKGTAFSKSARQSLHDFIFFCTPTTAAPPAIKGRKPQDVSQLLTADVVELFEFWINRPFRKNLMLIKQGERKPDQFAASDAACIYAILCGIDPSITPIQAKTALKKIPARKNEIQK